MNDENPTPNTNKVYLEEDGPDFSGDEENNMQEQDQVQINDSSPSQKNNSNLYLQNTELKENQDKLIQTLKIQIQQLKKTLENKNIELDAINNENNSMKLSFIKKHEEYLNMENAVDFLNMDKNKLNSKNQILEIENKESDKKIKELNYKIIELTQKILSYENKEAFNKKLDLMDENLSSEEKKNKFEQIYQIELNKLQTQLDEATIKNGKLIFENTTLMHKLQGLQNDKENEIFIMKELNQKQITNYEKCINNFKEQIDELINDKNQNKVIKTEDNFDKTELLSRLTEMEDNIRTYDNENFKLKKDLKKEKDKNEESNMIIESKDKIIEKLQNDMQIMENEYQNKLNEYEQNNLDKMNDDQQKELIIEKMNNRLEIISKENDSLKNEFTIMTKKVNDANQLFLNKKNEYEDKLEMKDYKLKEYKRKVIILKIKVNELLTDLEKYKNFQKQIEQNHKNLIVNQSSSQMSLHSAFNYKNMNDFDYNLYSSNTFNIMNNNKLSASRCNSIANSDNERALLKNRSENKIRLPRTPIHTVHNQPIRSQFIQEMMNEELKQKKFINDYKVTLKSYNPLQ